MFFRGSGSCWTVAARLCLVCCALVLAPPAFAASLTGIGDLSGGAFHSQAWGISADGSTVVGRATTEFGSQAVRWDAVNGLQGLGHLDGGGTTGRATAVSSDGSVIVGASDSMGSVASTSEFGTEAFRWDAASGMQGLGDLLGGPFASVARDVSADGAVVVGFSSATDLPGDSGTEAFRWEASTGLVGLGALPGGSIGTLATGISADASIIVGAAGRPDGENTVGFRWDAVNGYRDLGDRPDGELDYNARAISADGSVIAGRGFLPGIRWDEANGIRFLGPTDELGGIPNAVSDDGRMIGGDNSPFGAFIWTAETGVQGLDVFLAAMGVDVTGWTFDSVQGFSSDGRTIVGFGTNPSGNWEGFVAVVPEPSTATLLCLGLTALGAMRRDSSATRMCAIDASRQEVQFRPPASNSHS